MKSIFDFDEYREYLRSNIAEAPRGGYGQAKRLAEHLQVHTTLVSQVLRGIKTFTLEQAALVADFFHCSELESDYFLVLVQIDRAGNEPLKRQLQRQKKVLRSRSTELVNRLNSNKKLTDAERATFYSDWSYSAVRQMTAIDGYQHAEAIAKSLDLPVRDVKSAIQFLLKAGLCKLDQRGLTVGPSSTHLERSSPWVKAHHINWRLRSIELMRKQSDRALHYTAPMTLSARDAKRVRDQIVQLLENVDTLVEPSPSEEMHCLAIDWFRVDNSKRVF